MADRTVSIRPCYLIVDPEHGGAISTRKLVLETAKLNVITAYSSKEALAVLRKFPALDGVVLDAALHDMPCAELVRELKAIAPKLPIIVVGRPQQPWNCDGAEIYLESFNPVRLLEEIKRLHPQLVEPILAHDAELSAQGS